MFSKAEKPKTTARVAASQQVPSILAPGLKVIGNLITDGEVQIDGTVEGDLRCATLVVGEKALICGEVMAEKIVVRGQITGRIHARDVQLAKSAKVYGDIQHDTLSIETGAFLEGHCRRNDGQEQRYGQSETVTINTVDAPAGQKIAEVPKAKNAEQPRQKAVA